MISSVSLVIIIATYTMFEHQKKMNQKSSQILNNNLKVLGPNGKYFDFK